VPFYFETSQHRLVFLHDYSQRVPRGVDDCESFPLLNDFEVLTQGRWEDVPLREQKVEVTRLLWKNRHLVGGLYKRLSAYNQTDEEHFLPFKLKETAKISGRQETVSASLEVDGRAMLVAGRSQFSISKCPDFAKYLSGGWFEEFVYLQLRQFADSKLLRDLRIGVEAARSDWGREGGKSRAVQEFDGLMTDGRRLILVECKAGNVTVDQLFKLQQLARTYGGQEPHGLLIGAYPPHSKVVRDRIRAARNIHGIYGRDVENGLADLVLRILTPAGQNVPTQRIPNRLE